MKRGENSRYWSYYDREFGMTVAIPKPRWRDRIRAWYAINQIGRARKQAQREGWGQWGPLEGEETPRG